MEIIEPGATPASFCAEPAAGAGLRFQDPPLMLVESVCCWMTPPSPLAPKGRGLKAAWPLFSVSFGSCTSVYLFEEEEEDATGIVQRVYFAWANELPPIVTESE